MQSILLNDIFAKFLNKKAISGVLLLLTALVSLVIANSDYSDIYFKILNTQIGFSIGDSTLSMSLKQWINDALMSLFFLMVGLEIKREIIYGELSSFKKASLPILGAIGGMIVPITIYLIFNHTPNTFHGFGIPMATDIAFSLGILLLLGKKVPLQLKVFLVTLAIVDDLGAIIVIAIFYTSSLHITYILSSFIIFIILLLLNLFNVKQLLFYLLLGVLLWIFIHHSGIHATITGVILAITIPSKSKLKFESFFDLIMNSLDKFERYKNSEEYINKKQSYALQRISYAYENIQNPMIRLEYLLNPLNSYLIMPIFAFCNAGVVLEFDSLFSHQSLSLGIILGLIVGKPLGIFLFCYLSVKYKISELPSSLNYNHILGVAFLAGIGFTMSIFIANIAFVDTEFVDISKISVLLASIISAMIGTIMIFKFTKIEISKI